METTLRSAFLAKYNNPKIPSRWEEATGSPFAFTSITKPRLAAFATYLCEHGAATSARTYCAQLKAVINLYSDAIDLPRGWEKALTVHADTSESVYLTDDEVQRIIDYTPETETESIVQQQFILSCLVGARHGDIERLTAANMRDGYIVYVSEKTHQRVMVPVSPVAESILNGRFSHEEHLNEAYSHLKHVSDPTFNDAIRDICRKCDIDAVITIYRRGKTETGEKWRFVTSHTGRRTCATLLYLHDCDIYTISRILGHSSVEMTAKKYICTPIKQLREATMAYFNQFK